MITQITYKVVCERIKRRLANGWPNIKFNITDNEILLYFYDAVATVITKYSNDAYSAEGVRSVPEGFITTYKFTGTQISRDQDTGEYYIILPAPPVNLPLGYSIVSPTFAGSASRSYPLIAIHPHQRGYWNKIATPDYGVYYWVEGSMMYMDSRGVNLINSGLTLYLPILSPRSATGDYSDVVNIPDDAMNLCFEMVVQALTERRNTPTDRVNDGNSQYTQQP
jgi:hypothetical protein